MKEKIKRVIGRIQLEIFIRKAEFEIERGLARAECMAAPGAEDTDGQC